MYRSPHRFSTNILASAVLTLGMCSVAFAQEKPSDEKKGEAKSKPTKLELEGGKITMMAPKEWKRTTPKSPMLARMLAYEFAVPADAKEGDSTARVTVMPAGGSIEQNIARWISQFSQPDGKSTKEATKVEEFEAGGNKVHWVDITGTFSETMGGGPFSGGKTVKREGHRMIGAIVVPKGSQRKYFFKMTGEKKLVEKFAADYKKMLKEMKAK